ncbi:MAG: class I SAM-dependent methyltransferase [Acidobacteria bacterium]|nr:class I SAM-dependent methyltransferase [Acidobacteriota bacterium]
MKKLDKKLLDEAGKIRFKSEYNYALFEYYRSPKLFNELDMEGIDYSGVVLDNGCGSGGVAISFAEESEKVYALDIEPRFIGSGDKIAADKKIKNIEFIQGDGCDLPFEDNCIDLVLSHSVIEHTFKPLEYLKESYRVLKPGAIMFLETPPHYSFEGAHMPRLKKPIPMQLFLPRKFLYKFYIRTARRHPGWIKGGTDGSALLTDLANGKDLTMEKVDKMTIGRLRRLIKRSGFECLNERTYHPGFFDRFPKPLLSFFKKSIITRNFVNNTYKAFLRKPVN